MLNEESGYSEELETWMHKTIKKVTEDYEDMKFNTAVAAMMSLVNEFYDKGKITKDELRDLIIILNPIAPHITEEIWSNQNYDGMLNQTDWPKWEEEKTVEDVIEIPVQINGKVRAKVKVSKDASKDKVKEKAYQDESIVEFTEGKKIIKEIYVPGRIYNIVVK
jgi:leucyl-tRNA synthetase